VSISTSCDRKSDSTSNICCLVYHIPYFVVTYGKLVKYSWQGVEQINDDIKQIHQSKTNKYDAATIDAFLF
jgi:hypothetical protein